MCLSQSKGTQSNNIKAEPEKRTRFSHASMADSTSIFIWPPGILPNSSPESVQKN